MTDWPKGEVAGEACPRGAGTDMVRLADTVGCDVPGRWAGMCPCAAVLNGFDKAWTGYGETERRLPKVESAS